METRKRKPLPFDAVAQVFYPPKDGKGAVSPRARSKDDKPPASGSTGTILGGRLTTGTGPLHPRPFRSAAQTVYGDWERHHKDVQSSTQIAQTPDPDGGFESPISKEFRDGIHKGESLEKDYSDINENIPGEAWGRYQLTRDARRQIGMEREDGTLTGKYGVHSWEDFRKNIAAQERAFADLLRDAERQLMKFGALQRIGQRIEGLKGPITVTKSGLLAAAHRWGANGTRLYLDHLSRHDWKSDKGTFPLNRRDAFLAIETRLRKFQDIEHRAK